MACNGGGEVDILWAKLTNVAKGGGEASVVPDGEPEAKAGGYVQKGCGADDGHLGGDRRDGRGLP